MSSTPADDTLHRDDAEIERRLRSECYAVVLPGVEVGWDDDLFEVGGDSIMLMRLVSMAQIAFGVEVNALPYFQNPTMATLALQVEAAISSFQAHDPELDAILAQLQSMPDDDVQRLLDGQV